MGDKEHTMVCTQTGWNSIFECKACGRILSTYMDPISGKISRAVLQAGDESAQHMVLITPATILEAKEA